MNTTEQLKLSASVAEIGTIDFTFTPSTYDPATLQTIRDELEEYGEFTNGEYGTIELEDGQRFDWVCRKYMDAETFSWDATE